MGTLTDIFARERGEFASKAKKRSRFEAKDENSRTVRPLGSCCGTSSILAKYSSRVRSVSGKGGRAMLCASMHASLRKLRLGGREAGSAPRRRTPSSCRIVGSARGLASGFVHVVARNGTLHSMFDVPSHRRCVAAPPVPLPVRRPAGKIPVTSVTKTYAQGQPDMSTGRESSPCKCRTRDGKRSSEEHTEK